ncbi:MAG: Asp-tRNA(Asn)/Glu-tRNA(Gln) amidotransferase subunit GatC [Leptospiraceae bacterium]|nr:Asp-tRNA(Asn)/Glu-tRNA(Gln) amidotransferase subunit GatC [Leptospiraceae bacterium]
MLTAEQFNNLCQLARLDPADDSLQNLQNDFNRILDYVEQIGAVDVSLVDDALHREDAHNVMRPDEPGATTGPTSIARFAPVWESGHFVVPAVIDAE